MAASSDVDRIDSVKAGIARKPYATPRLVRFGDVRVLTQAGSGSLNENNPFNTSCNAEVLKKACTL